MLGGKVRKNPELSSHKKSQKTLKLKLAVKNNQPEDAKSGKLLAVTVAALEVLISGFGKGSQREGDEGDEGDEGNKAVSEKKFTT